jgi:Peptidase family M23
MKRSLSALLILICGFSAGQAPAQAAHPCDRFDRAREGNILQGICYAKSGHVRGNREEISRACEQLILCGPSGSDFAANTIRIRHAGGVVTSYLHIAMGSAVVRPGQTVRCGERIARIGSSGISSMPHLHFEVHDGGGQLVDPYAGPLSQPFSWWVDQGPNERRLPAPASGPAPMKRAAARGRGSSRASRDPAAGAG